MSLTPGRVSDWGGALGGAGFLFVLNECRFSYLLNIFKELARPVQSVRRWCCRTGCPGAVRATSSRWTPSPNGRCVPSAAGAYGLVCARLHLLDDGFVDEA